MESSTSFSTSKRSNKLREEIREQIPSLSNPTSNARQEDFPDPDRLPYLDLIIRECLRFIPPIPLTARQARLAAHLATHPIPPGTLICVPINRLPCYWGSDGDTFDTERWNKLPLGWAANSYMTFMQDPKGCIARNFATTELKVVLCCLISRFTFWTDERTEDAAEWKMWRVVLRPRLGG